MNDLESRVLDLIGENTASPDVFDDTGIAEIRSHLNDAIEEVCILTGCHKRVWHVPLKASAVFYEITSARDVFGWFSSVWLVGINRKLEQIDLNGLMHLDARWLYATGNPSHYAPIGHNKFAVYPATSSSTDTLEVTAVAIPDRYELDTDRVKLRKSFEWCCVNRAVSEFWATRGDAMTASSFFQVYANEVGQPQMYPEYAERRWSYKAKN